MGVCQNNKDNKRWQKYRFGGIENMIEVCAPGWEMGIERVTVLICSGAL